MPEAMLNSESSQSEEVIGSRFSWIDTLRALWYFVKEERAQAVIWQTLLTLIYVIEVFVPPYTIAKLSQLLISKQSSEPFRSFLLYALLLGLGLGLAGGYVDNHVYGNALGFYFDVHETGIALPVSGSTTPPTLSLVVPVRGRLAVETGFGAQWTQQQGNTLFDGQLSTRLDLAIYRGGYVAGGGNIRYIESTGSYGFAFAGANVAAGYRFPLIEGLDGRAEVSFTTFKERRDFPFAQNALAVLLGVTMTLE